AVILARPWMKCIIIYLSVWLIILMSTLVYKKQNIFLIN
ncbi:invasion protein invA, partial [Escherichia coli 97.0010]